MDASNSDSVGMDSLEAEAQELVSAVSLSAISSFTKFHEHIPVLAGVDFNRWVFYFTVAGTCAGLMRLANRAASEVHYNELTAILRKELFKWDASAERALSSCMTHVKNQLGLDVPDDPQHAFERLAYALGTWLLTSSFDRPLSEEEGGHAMMVGGFILTFLHDRWSEE